MAKPKKSDAAKTPKSGATVKQAVRGTDPAASATSSTIETPAPAPVDPRIAKQQMRQQAAMRPLSNLSVASAGRSNRFLAAALVFSVGAHAAAMVVHFTDDARLRVKNADPQLEVILVNAAGNTAPRNAQALAQVNLEGGGLHDAGRIKSPLPNSFQMQDGDALMAARQRLQELEEEQKRLLSQLTKSGLAVPPDPELKKETKSADPNQTDIDQLQKQIARMEAEISRNIEDYNKRPKVHYYRPSASAYRFAQYVEDWRERVEKLGTEHYPQAARGKVYGDVIVTVIIDKLGNLIDAVVEKTSGYQVLDQAALRTVRLGQPYKPFPPQIARDTDQISITRTFIYFNGTLAMRGPEAAGTTGNAGAAPTANPATKAAQP